MLGLLSGTSSFENSPYWWGPGGSREAWEEPRLSHISVPQCHRPWCSRQSVSVGEKCWKFQFGVQKGTWAQVGGGLPQLQEYPLQPRVGVLWCHLWAAPVPCSWPSVGQGWKWADQRGWGWGSSLVTCSCGQTGRRWRGQAQLSPFLANSQGFIINSDGSTEDIEEAMGWVFNCLKTSSSASYVRLGRGRL